MLNEYLLNIIMLNAIILNDAKCRYAECCSAQLSPLSDKKQSVTFIPKPML